MMDTIKILMLEDDPEDAEIIQNYLQNSGLNFHATIASTKKEYIKGLEEGSYDVILCDHYLHEFSSIEAIKIRNDKNLSTPFLLVSGAVSDASAVNIIKDGAHDYILKDRLQRLPAAITQALENEQNKQDKIKAEKELLKSKARFKLLFNSSSEVLFDSDIVTGEVQISDGYKKSYGYEVAENMTPVTDWAGHIHAEDREAVWKDYQRALTSNDSEWKYAYRFLRADNSVAYVVSSAVILRHTDGTAYRVVGAMKDVTDSKTLESEREKIISEVLGRNKELDQFAYLVSHNLRSPVSNIMALGEALSDASYPDELHKELLTHLNLSVSKLDNVIRDLNDTLQIKHNRDEVMEVVCFTDIVEDIKTGIKDVIEKYHVSIESDFAQADRLMTVKSYVYSVFLKLLSNSIKYRQPGLPPVISLKSFARGGGIELIISDNGLGIDLKKNGREIFGLYKRFHYHVEGKGMGLFLAKTEIEKLGGTIDVASEVNNGTAFKIFLPFITCS